ncbi:MAG: 30S ribosomal protein S9 [Crenarchaeota archaeon]|nr:30S ribosomal protein S9 [Thermoproteota archaeon]MCR8453579.1 30S ribosomal protein S9 [Thermoproteota archaeon]MCR8454778.1 30S ribosomal protein S9 [Thermoproteota archaeon]MCR8462670.1 30S ribosomal protein S9 [Thermoproteota archaeon]MCR8470289.1 30S ribosomal protein S9 [Thermoproteota archaeon]
MSTTTVSAILASATRKTARARCIITPGTGVVRINGKRVTFIENKYLRLLVLEPLLLIGKLAQQIDVRVKVRGGGLVSQLYAARCAIARAVVKYFQDPRLEKLFRWYDRYLLVEDTRQKEMKKFGGPGARARFQTSYR